MSDKEIIALYQDISNPSSFGTMPQFRNYLKAEKNVEITINKLKAILRAGVPSTTLFHHINETFPRRVLFTPTLDSSWSAGRVIMLILSDIALQRFQIWHFSHYQLCVAIDVVHFLSLWKISRCSAGCGRLKVQKR